MKKTILALSIIMSLAGSVSAKQAGEVRDVQLYQQQLATNDGSPVIRNSRRIRTNVLNGDYTVNRDGSVVAIMRIREANKISKREILFTYDIFSPEGLQLVSNLSGQVSRNQMVFSIPTPGFTEV